MNALALFLVLTTSTLVLRTGERIRVEGPVQEANGVVKFRSNGSLFSMPLEEIDLEASRKAAEAKTDPKPSARANGGTGADKAVRQLRATPEERKRLLKELEKNHAGTPPPRQRLLDDPPPPKPQEEVTEAKRDEWSWRREARVYEEAVTRAKEDLALLEGRIEELQSQIQTFFVLGYKAEQFTYQTTQLAHSRERIPHARLEITRAERELARFREDARRQGVPPSWLW